MSSAEAKRADARRRKILQNSENRLRKIQGLSPIRNPLENETDKDSFGEHATGENKNQLKDDFNPNVENKIRRLNSLNIPEEDLKYVPSEAIPQDVPEIKLNPFIIRSLKFCLLHRFIFYYLMAFAIRLVLSHRVSSFFVHHSLVLPFFAIYTLLFTSSKYLQAQHSRYLDRDYSFDRNKFNTMINQIIQGVLVVFKFDPYTIQLITTAFSFTQALTKDFAVYFTAFLLFDQLVFPPRFSDEAQQIH